MAEAGNALGDWTYPFAVGMAFFETTIPPVTLVYPGEWGLMLGGAIAGAGRAELVPLLAIGWLVSVLADSLTFLLGRRLGRPFLLRSGSGLGLTNERLAKVDGWFDRYGAMAVCFGRLLPLARPFGPFLAGASKLPIPPLPPLERARLPALLARIRWARVPVLQLIRPARRDGRPRGHPVLVAVVASVLLVRDVRRRGAPASEPVAVP